MERKYLYISIAALVVLGALILGWRVGEYRNITQLSVLDHPSSERLTSAGSIVSTTNKAINSMQNRTISNERSNIKEKVLPMLKEVHRLRAYPMMSEQISETYRKLMSDPKNIGEMKNILLSLDETKKLYGDDQAIARINAIGALAYLASIGEFEPIESVIENDAEILISKENLSQGEIADFSDLMTEWIHAKGVDRIGGDLSLITERFPYDPKLEQALKIALGNALGWKTNDPEMIRQFNRVFRGDRNENS